MLVKKTRCLEAVVQCATHRSRQGSRAREKWGLAPAKPCCPPARQTLAGYGKVASVGHLDHLGQESPIKWITLQAHTHRDAPVPRHSSFSARMAGGSPRTYQEKPRLSVLSVCSCSPLTTKNGDWLRPSHQHLDPSRLGRCLYPFFSQLSHSAEELIRSDDCCCSGVPATVRWYASLTFIEILVTKRF
jgi:hypothetical protein